MVTAALFLGVNRPVVGRESEAFGFLMGEAQEQLQTFQKAGWFESMQTVALTPHGGDLNVLILLNGNRAKLDELRRTDEFERFSMKIGRLFSGYGVVPCVTGDGLGKVRERNPDLFK